MHGLSDVLSIDPKKFSTMKKGVKGLARGPSKKIAQPVKHYRMELVPQQEQQFTDLAPRGKGN